MEFQTQTSQPLTALNLKDHFRN